MTVSSQGTNCNLLDLPQEVLHAISSHIKAHEWAQGPAQSCRLLSRMDLPRVALHLPIKHPALGMPRYEDVRCLAGLKWAAKRVGPSTQCLELFLSAWNCDEFSRADKELRASFDSAHLHLGQLLCLRAYVYCRDDTSLACPFLWLLQCTPNLLALSMGDMPLPLPKFLRFRSLRHLELGGRSLQFNFQPAQQLPVLQTLCINGYESELPEVDLLGCRQLSKLFMYGCSTQRLLLEPACHFSADVGILSDYPVERAWRAPFEGFLRSVCELSLFCQEPDYISLDNKGLLAGLPCLAVLNVNWPEEWSGGDEPDRNAFVDGAECLLTNCLASDGPPVLSLRVIIIMAASMQARIPGHLPNLEQLVILAEGRAELSFEEPEATILALKQFYAFGQPLKPDGMDAVRMSAALEGTGRALGADGGQRLQWRQLVCLPKA